MGGMNERTKFMLMCTLYATLAFILVSLAGTYKLTKGIFADKDKPDDYGVGQRFDQKGFLLHIVVFALLIFVPMKFNKEKN